MATKRVVIFPWRMTSSGAKMVAAQLTTMDVECIRVYSDRDYHPREGDLIFGWGSGYRPGWMDEIRSVNCQYINAPNSICNSVSKVTALKKFKACGVPIPDFSFDQEEAKKWVRRGDWVCVRHSTEGMDGAGLVLAQKEKDVEWAPLYTKYVPNSLEFRVYCFAGEVIDILKKCPTDETKDKYIKTTSNHYEYARDARGCTKAAQDAALEATDALGLTFAGVDLIMGDDGNPYVLETNTAPDIGQITAKKIATALKEYAGL